MNTNTLFTKLTSKKNGSFFNIEYTGELPVSKVGKSNGYSVFKVSKMIVRKGIEYSNQKAVQEQIENGKVLTHKLPFGSWKTGFDNLFIEHNGTDYVRLYVAPNNKTKTTYYLVKDNTITVIGLEELKKMNIIRNSYFNKPNTVPNALTIKVDNIVSIL